VLNCKTWFLVGFFFAGLGFGFGSGGGGFDFFLAPFCPSVLPFSSSMTPIFLVSGFLLYTVHL